MKRTNFINKKISEQSGITLVALVVTIIILLILAGITVASLTGDNGLIGKSGEAKKQTEISEGLEQLEIAVTQSTNKRGNIDETKLAKNLSKINGLKYINAENEEVDIAENTEIKLTAKVKLKGNTYKINAEGNVSYKKEGTVDNEDIINSPETYYGHYITNYNSSNNEGIAEGTDQLGKWQIFLVDDNNIYLIASNYISRYYTKEKDGVGLDYNRNIEDTKNAYNMWVASIRSKYNASATKNDIPNLLSKFSSYQVEKYHRWMSYEENQIKNAANAKSAAAMIDVDLWDGYKDSKYADYAIGGATVEMFCDSYNQTHSGDKLTPNLHNCGYLIQKGNASDASRVSGLKTNPNVDKMYFSSGLSEYYLLSSPSGGDGNYFNSYVGVVSGGTIGGYDHAFQSQYALRPVVCLKSDVYLKPNKINDTITYTLEID